MSDLEHAVNPADPLAQIQERLRAHPVYWYGSGNGRRDVEWLFLEVLRLRDVRTSPDALPAEEAP